ncbi:MAG: glutamine--fructose-6-phosphate transaminase (isomerizing) [Chloroflexi bacterium]|nr:glutamine--fructose-6-phosphate transaminase (isomerizing) [Chloroflexota bacterium]
MCGIVGYISKGNDERSVNIGIEALKRLEYRGYDSAGLAFWDRSGGIICQKAVGRISNLENKIGQNGFSPADPVILHTRWATHGNVCEANAHPHSDCTRDIFVAHNGIIENYPALKEQLIGEGHVFSSGTDTEVIAHLIEKCFEGNLEEAVRKSLGCLVGTYGLAVISGRDPNKIVAARLSSPLLVGLAEDYFLLASDPSAVIAHTRKVVYLDDGEIAVIGRSNFTIIREKKAEEIEWADGQHEKEGFPHYMLKEVMEQPESIEQTLKGRLIPEAGNAKLGGLDSVEQRLRQIDKVYIVGCGTARHAGLLGEYMFEEYAGISTRTDAASEFRYRKTLLDKNTALLAISQSGETADTLAAIRDARSRGALTMGITNVVGSTQARETDAGVYTRCGPEIGVASTKAFTSQVAALALFTLFLGRQRQMPLETGRRIVRELLRMPEMVEQTLQCDRQIKELAEKYRGFENFFYLGRKYNYPIAREGALKIKEIAYVHSEGSWGGELKHGELALISEDFPSICIVPKDSVYEKMVSNIEEIKARGGPVIAVTSEGNQEIESLADDVVYIPDTIEFLTPILSVIPLQLFAYHFAVLCGCDIDKPRNLAKSVTVE